MHRDLNFFKVIFIEFMNNSSLSFLFFLCLKIYIVCGSDNSQPLVTNKIYSFNGLLNLSLRKNKKRSLQDFVDRVVRKILMFPSLSLRFPHWCYKFIVLGLVTLMHLTRYSVETVKTCGYLDAYRVVATTLWNTTMACNDSVTSIFR